LDREQLIKQWKNEEDDFQLKGWDFSCIDGRLVSSNTPWDYKAVINSHLKENDNLLDMGTGGGEFLLTINHPYKNTYVTEAYLPNFILCKEQLSPLGITVKQTFEDDELPYEDEKFDLIINRHESFDISEINRILRRGGYFITQQVVNRNFSELAEVLNNKVVLDNPNHAVEVYANALDQLGFQVLMKDEVELPGRFYDVGAVIFYAKAVPWEIPDFSVETHTEKLLIIQDIIEKNGFFQATSGRFLLVARKP
jgi:SAM-dependent methyltransferase